MGLATSCRKRRAEPGAGAGDATTSGVERAPRIVGVVAIACVAAAGVAGVRHGPARAEGAVTAACIVRAELRGVVNAGTASYLEDALARAERQRCTALLVSVDTPGGMLEPTRRIVRAFLGSDVPVIAYVTPAAARAGSAGVFVTMAAHVAAMAPGSNIGAAHPVLGPTGSDPDEAGEEMARKVENDVAAMARAIATERGRNVEWAEAAVRESASATAREARRLGVIDLVAPTEAALLEALEGRAIALAGDRRVTLRTASAHPVDHPMTVQQWALATLGDPNVAYLLLMVGFFALVLEVYSPGFGVAGVAGALSLVLAAIGLELLPVTLGGVLLLAAAIAFFVAEIYVTSYGLLALAGLACMLGGAALLFDRSDPEWIADPSVALSWGLVLPLAVVVAAGVIALGWRAARRRRARSVTGAEGLLGELGAALTDVDARGGRVAVHGERWQAVSDERIEARAAVRVVGVRGLVVRVARAARAGEPEGGVA